MHAPVDCATTLLGRHHSSAARPIAELTRARRRAEIFHLPWLPSQVGGHVECVGENTHLAMCSPGLSIDDCFWPRIAIIVDLEHGPHLTSTSRDQSQKALNHTGHMYVSFRTRLHLLVFSFWMHPIWDLYCTRIGRLVDQLPPCIGNSRQHTPPSILDLAVRYRPRLRIVLVVQFAGIA